MKAEERWQARFRAARMTLPTWARMAPSRAVYRCNISGVWEIHAWDRATGASRQVTSRPRGTSHAAIDPTGQWIWWFSDTYGDEFGIWMRQPFHGGPEIAAHPDLAPGHPTGLALSAVGTAVVGRSSRHGFQVLHIKVGSDDKPAVIYESREFTQVAGISLDGSLIAVSHSEHGDSRHPALRVIRPNGSVAGELNDGPGKGFSGVRFAPAMADRRILALHERRGRREPLVWDPVTGEEREIWLRVPGEITADWYHDGRALLIGHNDRARTELYRYDLGGGHLTEIKTPHGVIHDAMPRPDGTVEYSWSSAARPPAIRASDGHVVMNQSGPSAPPSVPLEDVLVDGPGGRIHALVSRPSPGSPPYPTVFLLHGGPAAQDDDSFMPNVAAWVDMGFAVVRVNYRGSTGYGSAWRDALRGDVGHIELADVAAVRDWAINQGVADPDRMVLAGASWGGFLTLLGLATQPKWWAAGIAAVPITDHAAAYSDETEGLRAYHRALFGGSPQEVPELYAASSPISYLDSVEAPLLVLAGENDPRSPIRQIDKYLNKLAEGGHDFEVYRYPAGHAALVIEERIRQMAVQIEFACKHVGAPQPADTFS
ncbi:peptide hydrolase [Sphaerisporangium melleum]|uniref:Peptide hydrolase n=1 Tax=Sphaerisporangium melleum TaxID=321316 RepID=A0A917VP48_9ACTN|nr:prolyl oligopeptidase family serine peptidase [Sphaerisporangium melleum]GGL03534.1 peptide hydrolase [Sphaerisporangium melleum]GII74049.1 peptide hydrolase [Sphaerisporangium melleum]